MIAVQKGLGGGVEGSNKIQREREREIITRRRSAGGGYRGNKW